MCARGKHEAPDTLTSEEAVGPHRSVVGVAYISTVPDSSAIHDTPVQLPRRRTGPLLAIVYRLGAAVALVLVVVAVVYLDRGGYRDTDGSDVTLLDAAYYTVVSLSTTGYGDITPLSNSARVVNIFVVTPARVLFLIILVGTTLEVLTEQSRNMFRVTRWRDRVKDHLVVCGYGTKGQSAIRAAIADGTDPTKIVVVERDPAAGRAATAAGYTVVEGSATRSTVLAEAQVSRAKAIVICTDTDDSAVLATLTARELTGGKVRIVAAARENENGRLLRQSGAHQVVVSAETAGRLLGLSTSAPPLIDVVDDLLSTDTGMALRLRSASREEVGQAPRKLPDLVIALVRRGKLLRLSEPPASAVATGDMLVVIQDGGTNEKATNE